MTTGDSEILRDLADEAAIRHLIERYFFGLDRRDGKALASIYTPDGVERGDGTVVDVDSHVAALLRVGKFAYSHHIIGSVGIEIDGDRGTGDTYALAFLAVDEKDDEGGRGRMVVRGLRYLDDYVRTAEGWRISRRDGPIPLWQYEIDSMPPALPGFIFKT
ncbi:MAG: nuclear transport factor 2 family protein [Acidimicrobiales bacterium]|nr:nuclear transport factor 2 family protein [Acidimicrobiales bacterium]